MRIIAGQYRGRVLKSPPSMGVRPTSDRLRETLFNILAPRIEGVRFLDLCAGSGAVGIESLSRGARFSTFVDRSRRMCAIIEANLALCGITGEESEIFSSEAREFARHARTKPDMRGDGWDIVFFDPPYTTDYAPTIAEFGAAESNLLSANGILIAEHHHKNNLLDSVEALRRWRIVKQGDSCLSFYKTVARDE